MTVILQGVSTEKHIGEQTGKTVVGKQAVYCAGTADTSKSEEIFSMKLLSEATQEFPVMLMPTVTTLSHQEEFLSW